MDHEKKPNPEELRNDFLRYVEIVTKDGNRFPFKLTRLQERLWKMWQDAPKPVKWHIVKTGCWPHP